MQAPKQLSRNPTYECQDQRSYQTWNLLKRWTPLNALLARAISSSLPCDMADKEEAPIAQVATDADGDQSAKPVAEAAEPATASEAAKDDASKSKSDKEEHKADAKPADSKPKATPAKPEASENQQPAERTSGRRERKQTSFFQPEKKTETEKLEIKEVSAVL